MPIFSVLSFKSLTLKTGTATSTHLKENDDDNDDSGEEADHSELDTLLQQWQYEDGTVGVNYNEDKF